MGDELTTLTGLAGIAFVITGILCYAMFRGPTKKSKAKIALEECEKLKISHKVELSKLVGSHNQTLRTVRRLYLDQIKAVTVEQFKSFKKHIREADDLEILTQRITLMEARYKKLTGNSI